MRNLLWSLTATLVLILTACGEGDSIGTTQESINTSEQDNKCLNLATSKYNSLDPITVTDVPSFQIASQIFEPLLRFNENNLSLTPLLAQSWKVSEDDLEHIFKLKRGIYFHDNACFEGGKGRELKAADVVYTFKRMFSTENNYAYSLFQGKIKGSEEYKTNGGEIAGIKALNDYTVKFTLTAPSSNFINLLATTSSAIVAKEAIEEGVIVGTGPFSYDKTQDNNQKITLVKNNNYHSGNLPYVDCVSFNYIKNAKDQLDLFMKGGLDIIADLPSQSIKEIVENQIADFQEKPIKYVLGRYSKASTSYITLNTSIAPFNNIKIRKAVNLAINKAKIVDDILKGEAAEPGNHGIVPPAISGYDYRSVIGMSYNIAKAKKLLEEAGFPNGEGIPIITLNTLNNNTSIRVGLEIQKQLRANLGLNVELSSMSFIERNISEATLKSHMSLDGWLAETPDPTSFLSLFYGANVPKSNEEGSFPNESRYQNSKFDKLYEKALTTLNEKDRFELCLEADQIIANEVPAIMLWYYEDYHLTKSSVKGYVPNAMNILYLAETKIKAISPEKAAKK